MDPMERRAALMARMTNVDEAHAALDNLTLTASERRRRDRDYRDTNAELLDELGELNNGPLLPSTREQENRMLGADRFASNGAPANDSNRAALAPEQRVQDWARSQGMIPTDHEEGPRALDFGRYVRGMVTGNWRESDMERRAMSEGTLTAGGYAVPTILSSQIIDLARNRAQVLAAGAQLVPMSNQTVDLAKWAGDPTAAWHSENATITPSDAVLGRVRLQAKTLASIVIASRELIEDADPLTVSQSLTQAFAAQFALTVDLAALYGAGVAPQPQGLKTASGVTVTPIGANGAPPTNYDWLVNSVFAVRAANETPNAVLYAPRTAKSLALLKDTTNQPLQAPAYLDNVARFETAQIPTNLVVGTSGTTTSDAFCGDWTQLLVGVRTDLKIQVLSERYVDAGQVGFSAWWRGDIGMARTAAFNITSGLQ